MIPADSSQLTFVDCISLVALLALGERDKTTPEQRRAMADLVADVLHPASDAVGADATTPLIPLLTAARERHNPVGGGGAHADMVAAIRRFTVDGPNGEPSGDAERAIDNIAALTDPVAWPFDLASWEHALKLAKLSDYMADLTAALGDDVKELRDAAEAYFGGDFTKPDVRS